MFQVLLIWLLFIGDVISICPYGTQPSIYVGFRKNKNPAKGKTIGCLQRNNIVRIEFSFLIKKLSKNIKRQNILQIGYTSEPAIYIDNGNSFTIVTASGAKFSFPFTKFKFNPEYQYRIMFLVTQTSIYVEVDDVAMGSVSKPKHSISGTMPVYLSNPVDIPADAIITDLDVQSKAENDDSSQTPTIRPTSQDCVANNPGPFEPAVCSGDPHCTMFNQYNHNFQGNLDGFYYYMKPCLFKGYTNKDMPFNLIGKHFAYGDKLKTIEYIILQVFDTNKIYNIYLQGNNAKMEIVTTTRINGINTKNAKVLNKGLTKIGTKQLYMENTSVGVRVLLIIPNISCQFGLEFILRCQSKDDGRCKEHAITVSVPECYKCKTCCLMGDFYNKGEKTFNPKTGAVITTKTGEEPYYNKLAYKDDYFGCKFTNTPVTTSPTKKVTSKPLCEQSPKLLNLVKTNCQTGYNVFTTKKKPQCCKGKEKQCKRQIRNCLSDACICVQKIGEGITTKQISNCATKTIEGLLKDYCHLQPSSKSPTKSIKKPSKIPTNLPSKTPTQRPTLYCDNSPNEPGVVTGDPHFFMFNKVKHDYQGDKDSFYYYMTPCTFKGLTNDDMPFNLIGKHFAYGYKLKTVEYILLQIFDKKDIYQVYFQGDKIGYIKTNKKTITVLEKVKLTYIKIGTITKLGTKSLKLSNSIGHNGKKSIKVELIIPNIPCKNGLEFFLRCQSFDDGKCKEHALTVTIPQCYKCMTCCLLGDFYNKGAKTFNPLTGKIINTTTGKAPYNKNAYDDKKWGCLVKDTTYTPSPTKKDVGACDDLLFQDKVEKVCIESLKTFESKNPFCCKGKRDECDDQIDNCVSDSCLCLMDFKIPNALQIKTCANKNIDKLLHEICNLTPSSKSPSKKPTQSPIINIPKKCLPGKTAVASGDPHYSTFGGGKHSFQGNIDGFYYLMRPCKYKGLTNRHMPFNLISKNSGLGYTKMKSIEYFILEVFTQNNIRYYIYLQNTKAQYYKTNSIREILPMNKAPLISLKPGETLKMGKKSLKYTQGINDDAKVFSKIKLFIPDCKKLTALEVHVRGQAQEKGYFFENAIEVKVPECYKCATCGLLGDFYHKGQQIANPLTGRKIDIRTGAEPFLPNAYKDEIWGATVLATKATPSPIEVTLIFCDDEKETPVRTLSRKYCHEAYNKYTKKNPECCDKENQPDCLEQIDNCIADACVCVAHQYGPKNYKIGTRPCAYKQINSLMPETCNIVTGGKIKSAKTINIHNNYNKDKTNFVLRYYNKNYIEFGSIIFVIGILIGCCILGCIMFCFKNKNTKGYSPVISTNYSSSSSSDES